jgi:hypothetical protein
VGREISERFFAAVEWAWLGAWVRATWCSALAVALWCALYLCGCPTKAWPKFIGNYVDGGALVTFTGGVFALLETSGDDNARTLGE